MTFRKHIIGPKDKNLSWTLMADHTTLMLHGDMADHLGACVSHHRWAWTPADKVIQSPNGTEFAKALEKKAGKDYADWFRKEVCLAIPEHSEFIEFSELKVEVKFKPEGLYPIVHTQSRSVGLFFKESKNADGITFKTEAAPEIRANLLYLGGVDESGNLISTCHSDPDQKSKTPSERAAVVKKIFAALEKIGKVNPTTFGSFIRNTTSKPVSETPKMENSYTLEFENLKVVLNKPTPNELIVSVPKQTVALGLWIMGNAPVVDGYTFKCSSFPEFSKNKNIYLHGSNPDGSLRSGGNSHEYSSSANLDTYIPALAALKKLGLAHPDKFGAFISSDFDGGSVSSSTPTSTEYFLHFQNLRVEVKQEGSNVTITVPHQLSEVGAHLYTSRSKNGITFETAAHPYIHSLRIYLHGCNSKGRIIDTRNARTHTHTIEAGTDIVKNLAALKAYALEHQGIFGNHVSDNLSDPVISVASTSAPSSVACHFVKFKNLEIRMELSGSQLKITVPKQTKSLGKYLYSRRNHGDFSFETHTVPELRQSSKILFLAGCSSEGDARRSENTQTVSFSEDFVKEALVALVAFGKTKPEYFGHFIGSTVDSSDSEKIEIRTAKFHVVAIISGSIAEIRLPKQTKDIGTHFWTVRKHNGSEFETYDNCGVASSNRFRLHGVKGASGELSVAEGASKWTGAATNVKKHLQNLYSYILLNKPLFGDVEHVEGLAPITTEPVSEAWPTFHFISDNLDIKVSSKSREIEFEVLKQTVDVTSKCSGTSRPRFDDITIYSSLCPEISSSMFFLAGKDQILPVRKKQSAHWSTAVEATEQLTKHFNALRKAASAHPDIFGTIRHTSWTSEEIMPAFISDPGTLTLETEGLRVELKYTSGDTATINIPKQSPQVGTHLWARRNHNGIVFETAGAYQLSSQTLFLRPCLSSGELRADSQTHTFTDAPEFSDAVNIMTALKEYAKSNPEVFGRFIGDNISSVQVPPTSAAYDVSTCDHYIKFANYHIGVTVTDSAVKMWMPIQKPEVTRVFQSELATGTFVFKSMNCPEWKFDADVVFVCGDFSEDYTARSSENSRSGFSRAIQDSRVMQALSELLRTAKDRPEFGGVIATNIVSPTPISPAVPPVTRDAVAETSSAHLEYCESRDIEPAIVSPAPSKAVAFGLNMLAVNKEAAIIESKRQLGKTILGQAQSRLGEKLPDPLKPIFGTPLGKMLVANSVIVAADYYTGPHKDKVNVVTESILSAAASDVGDWFDINGLIDGFINSVKK